MARVIVVANLRSEPEASRIYFATERDVHLHLRNHRGNQTDACVDG